MSNALFQAINLGPLSLKNRVVMPPMTRSRADKNSDAANALMAEYYAQRASAGLIISEGTQISLLGKGYAWTPGIYTAEQVTGWRKVTDAVHAKGGVMFAQLWHVGRMSHPDNTGGEQAISASAIKAEGMQVFVDNGDGAPGFVEVDTPRAMNQDDINSVIEQFKQAALNALEAGFDGVELHAANGYLLNQFIDSESNQREDNYGGSIENRLRLLDQVITAVVAAVGKDRVGVRLAPHVNRDGELNSQRLDTYLAAARLLNRHQVAYLHIAEADWQDAPETPLSFKQTLRETYQGLIICAGRYQAATATQAIEQGYADMIGFGRPYIANPDLVERLQQGQALAEHDPNTLFGGAAAGFTDYPNYSAD